MGRELLRQLQLVGNSERGVREDRAPTALNGQLLAFGGLVAELVPQSTIDRCHIFVIRIHDHDVCSRVVLGSEDHLVATEL